MYKGVKEKGITDTYDTNLNDCNEVRKCQLGHTKPYHLQSFFILRSKDLGWRQQRSCSSRVDLAAPTTIPVVPLRCLGQHKYTKEKQNTVSTL